LKKLTSDCFKAVWDKMDPYKRINTFEVFGLDYMFDDEFKPYLIEVNTNPCLELSSPLLARLIPNMLENAFRITADPLFPPPEGWS
jgi:tubulin polyglutamylase TTLL1